MGAGSGSDVPVIMMSLVESSPRQRAVMRAAREVGLDVTETGKSTPEWPAGTNTWAGTMTAGLSLVSDT